MVSVDDHVRVTLDKLARQEEQSEGRIDALEQRVVSNVEESLAKRVATLEQATRDAVQKRVASVETRYMSRLGDVVAEKVEGSGRGWTLPFVVLVLVDVVAFVLARGWYVRFSRPVRTVRRARGASPPARLFAKAAILLGKAWLARGGGGKGGDIFRFFRPAGGALFIYLFTALTNSVPILGFYYARAALSICGILFPFGFFHNVRTALCSRRNK